MSAEPHLSTASKATYTLTAIAMLGAMGFLDYVTGPQIALSLFYLIPICWGAWNAGALVGVCLSVVGGVVWFLADSSYNVIYSHPLIPYWNAGMRFGFFVLTTLLIARTRRLTVSLEDRAASLSQQM